MHVLNESSALEQLFVKRILKNGGSEEKHQFLISLMRSHLEGHLCLETDVIPEFSKEILDDGIDLFPKTPIVRFHSYVYLQRNWVYETHILEQVQRLLHGTPTKANDADIFFQNLDQTNLLPTQKQALKRAFEKNFSIICGGPGTGKTYTASQLVRLLIASKKKEKYRVYLSAPTGKAATHLQSVLNLDSVQALTLHKLLRLNPSENRLFSYRKIDADLVIVDEASMIDVPLLAHLLESIGDETRLVLMGDPNQLPPVETGGIFSEMAALFGTPLTKSMRVENGSLDQLAEEIQRGRFSYPLLDWTFDRTFLEKLFEKVKPLICFEEPDPEKCLQNLNQFRVLGALRQGPFGIDALNHQIVSKMQATIQKGQWWAIPIMISKNDAAQDIYNGSCGILIGKSLNGRIYFKEAVAYFPKKIRYRDLPPFEVAFCLSIHKSQGSEFDSVLALFPKGSENFGKEALYTAITRAKKQLEVVAEKGVIETMLLRNSHKLSGFTKRVETIFLKETARVVDGSRSL